MPEIIWLVLCMTAITALSIHWEDSPVAMTAALTGMMYTILAGKGKLSCFIFGIVNAPLYAWIAFKTGYYGDFALNIYYFFMMFPGLFAWLKHQSENSEESTLRTRLTAKERLVLSAICIAGTVALWSILNFIGGVCPICDSLTNVLSITAMFLTVRRAIEEWVLWIAVDAIEVFMWWRTWQSGEGSISVLLMWLLFLANGIYLFSLWLRVEKNAGKKLSQSENRQASPGQE